MWSARYRTPRLRWMSPYSRKVVECARSAGISPRRLVQEHFLKISRWIIETEKPWHSKT